MARNPMHMIRRSLLGALFASPLKKSQPKPVSFYSNIKQLIFITHCNDFLPSTFSPTDQGGKWDGACDIHVPGGFHLGEGLERAGLAAGLGRDTVDLDTTGVLEPTGLTLDLVTETKMCYTYSILEYSIICKFQRFTL